MITLGIYDSRDSGATLVKDGEIIASIQEERLNRKKHFPGFPFQSIERCLEIACIDKNSVDNIAFTTNEFLIALHTHIFRKDSLPTNILRNPSDRIRTRIFEHYRQFLLKNKMVGKIDMSISKKIVKKLIRRIGFKKQPIYFIEHHKAHAMTAQSMDIRRKSLILTLDGQGNGLSGEIYIGRKGVLEERIGAFDIYSSLGHFYGGITELIGSNSGSDEGKTMALASFGNPKQTYKIFTRFFDVKNLDIVKNEPLRMYGRLTSLFLKTILRPYKNEDIAAGAQKILEDIVCNLVKNSIDYTGIRNILLSGGVFLNIKLNKELMELSEVKNIAIHPAAGDSGIATGAALIINTELGNSKLKKFSHVYLGDYFGNDYIEKVIKRKFSKFHFKCSYIDDISGYVAEELLPKGKIGGWFQGRMEYGPRALGARSVIADPRNSDICNKIRNTIKNRPAFQPFCQSLTKTAEKKYLMNPKNIDASFMIMAFDSTTKGIKECPAVVHIDNTIRPQVVDKKINKKYYDLIKLFGKETGVPVILNTSFNKSGEPIVRTPEEAIFDFYTAPLDFLAVGDYILERK
jgi:carbamoyltransferase